MRLFDGEDVHWDCRAHFFCAAAKAMRRILIEQARRRRRLKRGGDRRRVPLGGVEPTVPDRDEGLLDLDAALERLEELDRRKCDVVMLRYFTGLTVDETATVLGVSKRTVESEWTRARAWLFDVVSGRSCRDG